MNSSPIRTYMDNYHSMRASHDADRSDPKDLYSLGVVDLNISLSPDAFGLGAFAISKPLTQMLPGSSPCELWLMLPDSKIAIDGFHDIIVENLAASPTWRSRHISPGMSLLSAVNGRRPSSRLWDGAQRRWSDSVVSLVVNRSGHFRSVNWDSAQFVRSRSPLLWTFI